MCQKKFIPYWLTPQTWSTIGDVHRKSARATASTRPDPAHTRASLHAAARVSYREYAGNRLITSFNEIPVWRRGRDSNPRYRCRHTRFPGVPIKPLSHLSAEIPDAIHYRPCRNTIRCKKRERVAERAGFEPAVRCRTPLFESGALSHSATSPTAKYSNGTRVLIALEAPKITSLPDIVCLDLIQTGLIP